MRATSAGKRWVAWGGARKEEQERNGTIKAWRLESGYHSPLAKLFFYPSPPSCAWVWGVEREIEREREQVLGNGCPLGALGILVVVLLLFGRSEFEGEERWAGTRRLAWMRSRTRPLIW